MSQTIVLTPGTLPPGYCWTNPQTYYNDIIRLLVATMPGNFTAINFGNSKPAIENADKPWVRTNPDGSLDRMYTFNGQWVSPHPVPPSSGFTQIYKFKGSLADALTELYNADGGDGGLPASVTDVSGPMWIQDTDFDFRVPVGAGTNATVYNGGVGTVISPGGTGGEEKHTLLEPEIPAHRHLVVNGDMPAVGTTSPSPTNHVTANTAPVTGSTAAYYMGGTDTDAADGLSSAVGGDVNGVTVAHENMPPFYGVLFIRRSARKFYTIL